MIGSVSNSWASCLFIDSQCWKPYTAINFSFCLDDQLFYRITIGIAVVYKLLWFTLSYMTVNWDVYFRQYMGTIQWTWRSHWFHGAWRSYKGWHTVRHQHLISHSYWHYLSVSYRWWYFCCYFTCCLNYVYFCIFLSDFLICDLMQMLTVLISFKKH